MVEPRKRSATDIVANMKARYENTISELRSGFDELRQEVRVLRRRLSKYEAAPPIFPQAMLEQIKKMRAFGVPSRQLAELYEIDEARIERIMLDTEMPLIALRRRIG